MQITESVSLEASTTRSKRSVPEGKFAEGPDTRCSTAFRPRRSPICLSTSRFLKQLKTRTISKERSFCKSISWIYNKPRASHSFASATTSSSGSKRCGNSHAAGTLSESKESGYLYAIHRSGGRNSVASKPPVPTTFNLPAFRDL